MFRFPLVSCSKHWFRLGKILTHGERNRVFSLALSFALALSPPVFVAVICSWRKQNVLLLNNIIHRMSEPLCVSAWVWMSIEHWYGKVDSVDSLSWTLRARCFAICCVHIELVISYAFNSLLFHCSRCRMPISIVAIFFLLLLLLLLHSNHAQCHTNALFVWRARETNRWFSAAKGLRNTPEVLNKVTENRYLRFRLNLPHSIR